MQRAGGGIDVEQLVVERQEVYVMQDDVITLILAQEEPNVEQGCTVKSEIGENSVYIT